METDMDPSILTSRLHYLPPKDCLILEGTSASDVQQRIKNVNILLMFLLQREIEDWPQDLLDGLQETHQGPLAQELQQEYQRVVHASREHVEEMSNRGRSDPSTEVHVSYIFIIHFPYPCIEICWRCR